MSSSDLIGAVAIVVVVGLILVVVAQLVGLRRGRGPGRGGLDQLPTSEFRQLEDGSWEVFLVRDGVHREAFAAVREQRPDDVRMEVELRRAGRGRGSRAAVVVDGREVGRLHTAVAEALAPALADGPVACVARVRTRTSKRSGEERASLSVIVPAEAVAAAGHARR